MKQKKQRYFAADKIDEQIDYYLESQRYSQRPIDLQADNRDERETQLTLQELQQCFSMPGDVGERVQQVWQRLERRQAELETQNVLMQQSLLPKVTDRQRTRRKTMWAQVPEVNKTTGVSNKQQFSRFQPLAVVASIILIVGAMIFTYQAFHVGQHQSSAAQQVAQTTVSTQSANTELYTYTQQGEYYRLDPVTHKELWHFSVPQNTNASRYSRPIIKNGSVYILNASNDGEDVYALNAANGAVKWQTQAISSADSSLLSVSVGDLAVSDNTVYYAVYSASEGYSIVHALSAADGSNSWSMRYHGTGRGGMNMAASDASTGMIIQGITSNVLYAATLTGPDSAPIMKLYALDLRNNGRLLWSTNVPFIQSKGGVAELHGVILNDVLYYGGPSNATGSATIYGYNERKVQKKWTLPYRGQVTSIIEANGLLYAGTTQQNEQGIDSSGGVFVLHPQDGKVIWQYTKDGEGGSSIPTVQNGRVYITFSVRNNFTKAPLVVVALDVASGQERWSREVQNGVIGNIQPLVGQQFVYLTIQHEYSTSVVLLKLSDGSMAGDFTVHANLDTETSLLTMAP